MANSKTTPSADSLKGIGKNTEESGIKKKQSRKEAFDAKIKALAAKGKWDSVVKSLQRQEGNNDEKHCKYRDSMDITLVERNPDESEWYPTSKNIRKFSSSNDWIEIIFSKRPEDMWQLTAKPKLIEAIQTLSTRQSEVMYWLYVRCLNATEVANLLGTSDRYIRKVRKTALEAMRRVMDIASDNSGLGYVDSCAKTLAWMVLPTFMFGWEVSKRLYPRLKRLVAGQAA